MSRRRALSSLVGASAAAMGVGLPVDVKRRRASAAADPPDPATDPWAGFAEVPHVFPDNPDDAARARTLRVPEGFTADVVIRWGDPVVPGAPAFDPMMMPTVAGQEGAFGYNNDFIAVVPLELRAKVRDRGLLCVNHEYTTAELMFQGVDRKDKLDRLTDDQLRIEMAAHGHSVVEIARDQSGCWRPVPDSALNRRLSALSTAMEVTGPAAGHERLRTAADPTGTRVVGTLNNCAGGVTPWGTVLVAEENFHQYFKGDPSLGSEAANHRRYGVGAELKYAWHRIDERFDLEKHPHEPNRFGWMVEYDPRDPKSVPRKRTALGRMKHEGAACALNHDGRVVVYMGDDQVFEFVYKFVSSRPRDPWNPAANRDLLDEGTLYAARFGEDGYVRWLPLVFGEGPLTEEQGFRSQADVLIETRRAAGLVGATPMDRPEDVEENPHTHRVYVVLTNNSKRTPGLVDSANPRADNAHGHVVELVVPFVDGRPDHAALTHPWDLFLKGGDPNQTGDGARYHRNVSAHGWLSCPDNCTFDAKGRLWIATDGAQSAAGFNDGVYVCETVGPERALTRQFLHGPVGAEICGPWVSDDDTTLFIAVQHPGEGSDLSAPSTRWPHADDSPLPPMPAVVAVQRAFRQGGPAPSSAAGTAPAS